MTTPIDPPFNLHAVANGVEDTVDPVVPWVDEGDISVPQVAPVEDADGDTIADRVAHMIGYEGKTRRDGSEPRNGRAQRPQRAAKPPKPIPPKPRPGQLVKPLTDLYVSIGTMMLPFDQCGLVVIQSAPKCAEALEQLARESPAVRRALLALVETSVWGAVMAAHAPIMLAVAMHHVPAVRNAMPPSPETNGHRAWQPDDAVS